MNFLFPSFLFALTAIAIPIIIHLFNFRKFKVVYFSNVQFLKNVQQETKAKSQLKHIIVLILRILTLTAMVFAFAQPFIPASNVAVSPKQNIVGIYVDNSFSMDADCKQGNMLEVAKNKARSIADAYPASTRFLLTTNDLELKHQHLVNKEQLSDFITKIQISPNSKKISEIVSRQKDFLQSDNQEKNNHGNLFLISDFQKSVTDINILKNDSSVDIHLLPIETQATNNLFIDSCWFESPFRKYNQQEELFVKVVNKSTEVYNNIPIKIIINDSLKALGSFNIAPNTSETVSMKFTNNASGNFNGLAEISDYPIIYDNTFYFTYTIAKTLDLLIINGQKESKYLSALYGGDDYFKLTNSSEKNIQTSSFPNYHLIILNEVKNISTGIAQELITFANNGGSVLFIPDLSGDIDSYNNFMLQCKSNTILATDTHKTKIDFVNYNNSIYSNVFQKKEENADLPVISKQFKFSEISSSNDEALLKTQNKNTVLSMVHQGKGRIYFMSIPLSAETNNFAKHPLFVPSFYNIALNSKPSASLYNTIGKDNTIEIAETSITETDKVFHITDLKSKTDFIPQHNISNSLIRLFINNNISKSGNYNISYDNNVIAGSAFNYDRKESDLNYYNEADINDILKKNNLKNYTILDTDTKFLTKTVQQINRGTQLWKLFVILALIFIAGEIAVLRLWKK